MIEYYLQHCFLISFVLLAWLETDAFYEYCKLFGFKKLFKIKEYADFEGDSVTLGFSSDAKDLSVNMGYLEYLQTEYDSFFIRLITCPICLGTWLNIIICLILKDFSFFFVKLWVSFVLYFTVLLLMKKSN